MSEANKAIARRMYEEIFNEGKLEIIDDLIAEDAIEHEMIPGVEASGRDAIVQAVTMFRTAFPDLHTQVLDIVAEGDLVATRIVFEGTHQGQFMDIPATGKKIHFEGMDFIRFENGQATEHWGVSDSLGMLQQLGVIPSE